MRVVVEVEIRRPAKDIFEFLAKHENHTRFIKENVTSEQVTPGPMAVGTVVKNVARAMGQTMLEQFQITHFEPHKVLGKASMPGSSFDTTDRFDLTPTANGTRVQITVTGSPRHFGQRLMMLLIEPVMRRSMTKALGILKEILEAAPASAAA